MTTKNLSVASSRRQFLTKTLPAGTLFCLGCKSLLAVPHIFGGQQTPGQKHKFLEDSGMTVEQVFRFSFENGIPILQNLAKEIGREKFLEMLIKASSENIVQFVSSMAKNLPKRDMAIFADWISKILKTFPDSKAVTFEVVEKTDKVFEVKFTECLYAKILREMKAADIGYAVYCYPSNSMAQAFNPKMKAIGLKNLMKGDDVCIERFVLEA
jgi:hypothetical protein